jgi:transcription antitermination protein NusB
MPSRRKARELALQMLFQWEVGQQPPDFVLQTFLGGRKLAAEVAAFAASLFQGTVGEAALLDATIQKHTPNWKIARMAAVDRNILRMGLYEILHFPETPPAVVINEALELARRFSGEDSVEFVNGVLDGIHKSLPASDSKPAENTKPH